MTKLRGAVTRETAEMERTNPVCIRLHPKYLEVWIKGTRQSFSVDYLALLDWLRKREWKSKGAKP